MKVNELLCEGDFPKGSSRIKEFSEELCEFLKDSGHKCVYINLYGRVWSRSTGGKYRDPQHGIRFIDDVARNKAWKTVKENGKTFRWSDSAYDKDGRDAVRIGRFIVSPESRNDGSYLLIQGVDVLKNTNIRSVKEDRYHDQWAKDRAAENRARAKELKAAEKAALAASKPAKPARQVKPKTDLGQLWNLAQDAIGNSFPDGDPIDHLPRDIDMDLVDKAVKQFAGPRGKGKAKYGMYDYLADMWDDTQGDMLHDAKEMLKRKDFRLFDHDVGSNFYDVEGGPGWKEDHKAWDKWDQVKITPRRNPWK